ncbi:MAG: DUF6585 family protein [Anaerolineae bacterium]
MNTGDVLFTFSVDPNRQLMRLLSALAMGVWLLMSTASLAAVAAPPEDVSVAAYLSTWGFIGAFMFVLPAAVLVYMLRNHFQARGKQLQIGDSGFTLVQGGASVSYAWKDIASYNEVFLPSSLFRWRSSRQLHLGVAGRKPIVVLDDYQSTSALFLLLSVRVSETLLTRYLTAFARGETLSIGSLVMDRKEISQLGSVMRWDEIHDWQVTPMGIVLRRDNNAMGMIVDTLRLPNSQLLPALFKELMRMRRRD